MKKIIFILSTILVAGSIMSFTIADKPNLTITKTKNAAGDWELKIHNETDHYIDEFYAADLQEALKHEAKAWHQGHWTGEQHFIAPDETITITLSDVEGGEYLIYTQDNHAHHGYLYKVDLDHGIELGDDDEQDDLVDDVFGKDKEQGEVVDMDDLDDDENEEDDDKDEKAADHDDDK